jgi:hypothetical protein
VPTRSTDSSAPKCRSDEDDPRKRRPTILNDDPTIPGLDTSR